MGPRLARLQLYLRWVVEQFGQVIAVDAVSRHLHAQLMMLDGRVHPRGGAQRDAHGRPARNFVMNPKAMMGELFAEVDAEPAED